MSDEKNPSDETPFADIVDGRFSCYEYGPGDLSRTTFAVAGYAGGCRACLWALLAVRLGDCVVSHWGPWLAGRRPNPGLMTTVLYAIDVVFAGAVLVGKVY